MLTKNEILEQIKNGYELSFQYHKSINDAFLLNCLILIIKKAFHISNEEWDSAHKKAEQEITSYKKY
jgi:hypothetical protein